ncbi:MAG: 6-bladed beta-propeller [Marinifilaceae bacterium]
MRKYVYNTLIFIFILMGCSNKKNRIDIKEIDISNVKETANLTERDLIEDIQLIQLEMTENSMLSDIKHIKMSHDRIFICDVDNDAFLFDRIGKFRAKIGKAGRGPEEYGSIHSIFIDRDKEVFGIVDYHNILYYDKDGNFIEKKEIRKTVVDSPYDVEVYAGKILVLNMLCDKNQYNVMIDDLYDDAINFTFYQPMINNRFSRQSIAGNAFAVNLASVVPDGIVYTHLFTDTVYLFDGNEIYPKYLIKEGDNKLDKELISNYNKELAPYCSPFDLGKYKENVGIWIFHETDTHILIDGNTLYDKVSERCIKLSRVNSKEHYFGLFLIRCPEIYDNYFVGHYDYKHFKSMKENETKWDPMLVSRIENIETEVNPMIIMYKFKEIIEE